MSILVIFASKIFFCYNYTLGAKLFKLKENNTNIKTELIAGLTCFLSVVYIIPLNASLVGSCGMPISALILAASLASAFASIFCALFSNTPVIISVAMGLNAYFAFDVVMGRHIPWQSALGGVFISACIFFILSFTSFRRACIDAIPPDLKRAIGAGIGLFIAFIGLNSTGIIVKNPDTFLALGDIASPKTLLSIFTLLLLLFFWIKNIKAGFLLGIILSTILAWVLKIEPLPSTFISLPDFKQDLFDVAFKLDFKDVLSFAFLPIILSFLITQLFDSISVISCIGVKEGIFRGQKGEKKLGRVMIADASGSLLSPLLGTTTLTTLVESQIGVQAGAKTGLSGLFTGLLFLLCIFFVPLFRAIPSCAIYPMLIIIGVMMFSEVGKIDFKDHALGVGAFFIIIMMPFTYSITLGFSIGFLIFLVICLFKKEFSRLSPGVLLLGLISLVILGLNL